jgi:hypothetical protein
MIANFTDCDAMHLPNGMMVVPTGGTGRVAV